MAISPIPSTRVSDLFMRQRLLGQLQFDQSQLFKLHNQISTGRRLAVPSDDAPAALRAIALQSLLERKDQVRDNLLTNRSYLAASDSAGGEISNMLAAARVTAISATGDTATAVERAAAAVQISRTIDQMLDVSNQLFRGRYLFAGSKTATRPFELRSGVVDYAGDRKHILSYSDIDLLFETNVPGDAVFGAISDASRGTVDLNPALSGATRLADLRGGQGISGGSIAVSDGATTRVIDLGSAATIGDVARLLQANPPSGRVVTARVTSSGLSVSLDPAGGGTLSISEVAGGTTAAQLGILAAPPAGTLSVQGLDLNPAITLTTPLARLLGTQATALLQPAGAANDIVLTAAANGADFNGVAIQVVDDWKGQAAPGLLAGNETANYSATATQARASLKLNGSGNDLILTAVQAGSAFNNVSVDIVDGGNLGDAATATYNAGTRTLTLAVDDSGQTSTDALIAAIAIEGTFSAARDDSWEPNAAGGTVSPLNFGTGKANTLNSGGDAGTLFIHVQRGYSTAAGVVAAINAEGTFTAQLDSNEAGNNGSGLVLDTPTDPAASAVTSGGGGTTLDQAAGLRIENAGQVFQIDISGAHTVQDLLNLLNGAGAGLLARINDAGTAIDVQSRWSGGDFSIGENGGSTATDLGLRTLTLSTPLAELNHGRGVTQVDGVDLIIHRKDGVEFGVELAGAVTLGDVVEAINTNATNLASGVPLVARLALVGNGIELVHDDPAGPDAIAVRGSPFTQPARDLGLLPNGAATSNPPTAGTAASVRLASPGANNDLVISALANGPATNGVAVSFVDTGLGAGNETVTYDSLAGTLVFDIDQATTTAGGVVALLAADPVAGAVFSAALDPADGTPNDGSGLVDLGAAGSLAGGTAETLTGEDRNPQEVHGVFTALLRLRAALEANDVPGIERAVALLDESASNANFARAELGSRQQALDAMDGRLQDEDVQLKSALSGDLDVDLAAAISELTARQVAFEASLKATGLITRLSLMDFL